MRFTLSFIFLLCVNFSFSQESEVPKTGHFAFAEIFLNKRKVIQGDIYIFSRWENRAVIRIDHKNYKLRNINFNIRDDRFESMIGKDSIFILDIKPIQHIYINNRKFQNFYFSKKKRSQNFEIIYEGPDFKLLRGYETGIKYGETDPLMVKETVDNYFTTKTHYIKDENGIVRLPSKKKNILLPFKDKANSIQSFVKENKLSFKKDKDLKKIFNYYKSL